MTMGEGRRRDYNDFSLRMSSSLSKMWVYCVVETYQGCVVLWKPITKQYHPSAALIREFYSNLSVHSYDSNTLVRSWIWDE